MSTNFSELYDAMVILVWSMDVFPNLMFISIVSLIFVYAAFLSSKSDLYWHLTGALDRVALQIFGFFMIFMSYRLKYFSK